MEKLYKIGVLFLIILMGNKLYAQKIDRVEHGQTYMNIKEMSYFDFKDKGRSDFRIRGKKFSYWLCNGRDAWAIDSSFLSSEFIGVICDKNDDLCDLYKKELRKMIRQFYGEDGEYNFGKDFKEGRKETYDYMKLYLEKFDIISEYIRELYNYSVEKQKEEEEMSNELNKISKSTDEEKSRINKQRENDVVLRTVIDNSKKAIKRVEMSFDNKIKRLQDIKQKELKNLPMTNYEKNKSKIILKYNRQIASLKSQKIEKLGEEKLLWDNKIKVRRNEIEKNIKNELSDLNSSKHKQQSAKREEMRTKSTLNQDRVDIEERYKKSIEDINSKLKEQVNKAKKSRSKFKLW